MTMLSRDSFNRASESILSEKRKFITHFNNQLKDELYGTEMFG